ncbi:hypothetical protein NC653_016435 [Populus alba x Populus x berolinensis]|uniref:Uncharacterized protein n=1 Tax=Populus alba x Populus x berolinensis TaxID=444605 RepID=A0AAD6QMU5_9ROSI|nr:hypothetical protein NC653_016435 [Populus alba x Populus x berolinensis]
MDALHETVVKIEKDVLLFSSFWGKTTCSR